MAAVARAAGVDVAAISRRSWTRERSTAARIAAAWLLRNRCGMSFEQIGRSLRCRKQGAWKLVSWVWLRDDALAIATAADEQLKRKPVDVDALLRKAREDARGAS